MPYALLAEITNTKSKYAYKEVSSILYHIHIWGHGHHQFFD